MVIAVCVRQRQLMYDAAGDLDHDWERGEEGVKKSH